MKKTETDKNADTKFEEKLDRELYNFPDNFSTDELYEMLPSMIRFKNDELIGEYFLHLMKSTSKKQTMIYYIDNDNNHLAKTYRTGKTLRESIIVMINWLKEFEYH